MIAKQLTEHTYLLTSYLGHHVAVVLKRGTVFISSHDPTKQYTKLEDIAKDFAEPLTEANTEKEEAMSEILGYPIKHSSAFNISNDTLPIYTNKDKSTVFFAAGWWVLETGGQYRVSLSPKVTTINENSNGPHKDKFSANFEMARLKNKKEI